MILIDSRVGSKELETPLKKWGMPVAVTQLAFGDAAFEGHGPEGNIMIGVERKRIGDILKCIDDGRYAGFQQPGMVDQYQRRVLIVEGIWKANMQGHLIEKGGGTNWIHPLGPTTPVMYDKLFRFLLSVYLIAGTPVIQSSSIDQTAYQIKNLWGWFSKPWDQHSSQFQVANVVVPSFVRPTFLRKVACQIDYIGAKRSLEVSKAFKSLRELACSDELAWMHKVGVGAKTAQRIVRQINGIREAM